IPADTRKPNYTADHSGHLVIIGQDGHPHGFIRAPLNNTQLDAQLPGVLKPQD
ncbi:SCO family protein, partial [Pseudomonas aeruginosa]